MKSKLTCLIAALSLLFMGFSYAQEKTITGNVTDQDGLPLPGVAVLVVGTTTGAQTDFDGNYTITANVGSVLRFSYLGQQTVDRTVGAPSTINVQMQEDAQALEEVVVTAFGGTKQKRATTYATVAVDAKELTTVSNASVFESLSGKIAGADITAPAQPGASAKVVIRGFTSITGSNAPLYIVDGTPINSSVSGTSGSAEFERSYDAGNGISDIDPNSIANMSVLKGAAATALYGSRAANGAILITTKKGRSSSKLMVDFSSAMDYLEVSRVPHLQNGWGEGWNGKSYSALPSGPGASNENGSWGAPFDGTVRPWGNIVDNAQQIKPYVALPDNIKEFYDVGNAYTNSIRVSGGNDTSDFSLTVSNLTLDGVIPTDADQLKRRAMSFNGGMHGDKLSVRVTANYIKRDQNAVNTGQGDDAGEGATFSQEIIQVPRDISLLDLKDYKNNPFNTPGDFYTPYAQNPYFVLNENGTEITEDRIFGNMNFNYNLNSYLSANWVIGGDIRNIRTESHGAIVDYPDGSAQDLAAATEVVGGVSEEKRTLKVYDTYFNINYNRDLTDDLSLNVIAGLNYNERQSNRLKVSVTDLDIPNYYELGNSANRPVVVQQDSKRRTYGIYGQAELGYLNKYFLNLTARNDWSSTLPVAENSYFYPSISGSAVLLDSFDAYFKLRAGWSRVGNDTDPYLTESTLIQGTAASYFGRITFPIGGVNAYELDSQLGNNALKPEITDEIEIGFDSNFFNNRVSLDFSVYKRETSDLIVNLPIDPSTGFTLFAGNFADVENKGIEAVLGLTPVKINDFKWDLTYTFTKNENRVTDLFGGVDKLTINDAYGINFYAVKDRPLGVFYGHVPLKTDDGQFIVNPDTGYYEQSPDEEEIGTSQRDFIMGLTNRFTYKNFGLSFNFDWKQGGEMYSYTGRLLNFTGNAISTTYNERNPFVIPNSVNQNDDGSISENSTPITFENVTNFYNRGNNAAYEYNDVIDKTFVRLRDISLTYTLNGDFCEKIGLRNASITAYSKNLFMWTPDANPYVDPEVSTFGDDLDSEFGEFAANPAQRSYGVKFNIGL
ncbi:SusC/RagA family TonB-linked outer membrane protein [Flavobacteriaceae bacterium F89]|uniref:SusC/RagA family TonB-linked outer membrane protein n=1 Tax=Cerina litoralis TaxID=2874477 RepID=A0AAE3EYR6_9FLAO|nr:SusC/RagA family TonB-linked outer membrane protein [Cerina litoralis]MCG2462639.1 SusC/RagA family TonB-linked outer membrane protein [Cerina litoralis]